MQAAFITDGFLRKSLSATRSLGEKGIKTVVGESSLFSPSGFSKHCYKRLIYPDPKKNSRQFFVWLFKHLSDEKCPVFLPMDDVVLDIIMEKRDEIQKVCRFLLPSIDSYKIASDKFETIKLAITQGVRSPRTYHPTNLGELEGVANNLGFPLIIKPRKSSGSRGIRRVEDKETLLQLFTEINKEYAEIMIQEWIPLGDRYDVCLLYDKNHQVKASFVQKELRHFPIPMGPSTVQESVFNEELIRISTRLLEPLNWVGIVEVEFMMDPRTSEPILMEINPRFWNSLELAIQCGVDFPYLLYQLCIEEDINPKQEYKIGRKCRWLFPGDVLHFLFNSKRFSMIPTFFAGKKQSVYDDTFNLSDPLPGIILILSCFKHAFSLKSWKMFFTR